MVREAIAIFIRHQSGSHSLSFQLLLLLIYLSSSTSLHSLDLQAFNAAAASQGCMNNLTFGDSTFGYYETIAGGAGAGPSWEGTSGVHTHMTNTRITDVEVRL